jgi:hypothetical protein
MDLTGPPIPSPHDSRLRWIQLAQLDEFPFNEGALANAVIDPESDVTTVPLETRITKDGAEDHFSTFR